MRILPVIRNLGGCGGTLVTRLFAALPATIVLSETNPRSASLFGGVLNPLAQLRRWRPDLLEGLGNFDETELGYPEKFGEFLDRLHGTALRHGVRLILRDFNYADFIGVPFIWPVPADFSLDAAVAGRFEIRDIALVRAPAAQLASLRTHRALSQVLTAQQYLTGCLRFLDATPNSPRFHYESLVTAPPENFRAMCEALGLAFDDAALRDFSKVTNVTGHVSRFEQPVIAPPRPGPAADAAALALRALPGYRELLARLGYEGRDADAC